MASKIKGTKIRKGRSTDTRVSRQWTPRCRAQEFSDRRWKRRRTRSAMEAKIIEDHLS